MPTSVFSRFRLIVCLLFVATLVGCGGSSNVSVTGKVINDDQPLTTGTVTFHGAAIQSAEIDSSGNYTVEAAPGTYKVTVFAEKPRAEEGEDAYAEPEYLVAESFNNIATTTLSVDVKSGAADGAYDLKVASK